MRLRGSAVLVLTLTSSACGPDEGRDPGDSATTQPATDANPTTSTGPGTSTTVTPTTTDDGTTAVATTSGATTTSATSTGDDTTVGLSSGGSETGGPKLDLGVPEPSPIPVHDIPGLESITFYETTGQITEYTFLVNGPELSTLLADPLSMANRDIQGTSEEFYDVYYSEEDGTFNPDGSYLTIAGSFGAKLPAGGGLKISLNYADNSVEFGSFLASFVGLGDNYAMGSEPNAIDGDLATHTTMGNNVDEPNKRLRVTLGFKSSLMPG
jgi:hypothetical protein